MKWIDVRKELPEYSERVLVNAVKKYETGEAKFFITIADRRFTNKDGHCWVDDRDDLKYWQVTHWMNLPEAATL